MLEAGFLILPALLVLLVLGAAAPRLPRAAFVRFILAVGVWLALVAAASGSGWLARFEARPPPLALLFLACMAAAVGLARSRVGEALATLPLAALVGFQAFRLPLELLMHEAAAQGVMPPQMTWTGLNLDVLTGASAPVVAWLVGTGRAGPALVRAWSWVGCALLAVVVAVALASTPMVHAFGTDPAHLNTFVARPPYTSLPAVMVVLALAGHLVLFRALGRERAGGPAAGAAARA